MPYKMSKRGSKFCVVSETTGESKGCSDSKSMAVGHMRALYAAEGKTKKEINSLVAKSLLDMEEIPESEQDEKSLYEVEGSMTPMYYGSPTTYEELDTLEEAKETEMEVNELLSDFPILVGNIMYAPDIADKPAAIVALANELAGRLQSIQSEPQEEEKELGDQEDQTENIFNRVINSVKELLGLSKKDENMMLWKEADGTWHWLARYSNSFRDRDNPPEIIASESHRYFVDRVDKGLAPLPELWLWHIKNWKFGQATWVAYDQVDEKSGFALAYGYILPGFEQVAEWLSNQKNVKVSHGMPVTTIKRDKDDSTIIIEHETREISPLPDWAAANEITGFVAFKEVDMAIPAEKRRKLIAWGLSEELLARVEQANAEDADKAVSGGIESKELPVAEETPNAEDVTKEEILETPVEETTEVSQDFPTRDEIAEAMRAIVASVTELGERVNAISKELSEKRAAEEAEDKEKARNTPRASLLALIADSNRAVGSPRNEVDADSYLALSKPKEADPGTNRTGIPFIDEMLKR